MNINNILAIDTSIAQTLLLSLETSSQKYQKKITVSDLESELIEHVDHAMNECNITLKDIDAYIIGAGPGSFMGLRLGFSVIRTWAWLHQKPIFTVSSLDLLTRSYGDEWEGILVPCVDAKMKRVFVNISLKGQTLLEDSDLLPEELAQKLLEISSHHNTPIKVIGSGANLLKDFIDLKEVSYEEEVTLSEKAFDHLSDLVPKKIGSVQECLDKAFPNYIRLSAAEMALNESKKLNH
ncbi:MAG: tRNA (adenosine(37)-N6)-threonylcarbamoyltransferase complex dimerization subunit type 1 TsaB [Brevinema sp.]